MISPRKLIKMAKKWQRMAVLGRKRLSFPTTYYNDHAEAAEKGHFVVYTTDKRRFTFPIAYLNSLVFRELLRMSEDEFGLSSDGPITLPCDSQFMSYATSLLRKKAAKEVEKALLMSIVATCKSSTSSSYYTHHHETSHNVMLYAGC